MGAATAGKTFDRDLFCKLLLLMDSPNEFERQRASVQAIQMCMARGMRFCDMAGQSFGQGGKRLLEIEAQLEDARRGGDELADELKRKEAAIEEYRKAERTRHRICRPCESKRRVIAYFVGFWIYVMWQHRYPVGDVPLTRTCCGLGLSSSPLAYLFIRWRVLAFRRKRHWVTWRDNDLFRDLAARWNLFLGRFVIEEED